MLPPGPRKDAITPRFSSQRLWSASELPTDMGAGEANRRLLLFCAVSLLAAGPYLVSVRARRRLPGGGPGLQSRASPPGHRPARLHSSLWGHHPPATDAEAILARPAFAPFAHYPL